MWELKMQEATSRETILAQETAEMWELKMQTTRKSALTSLEAQEAMARETIIAQEQGPKEEALEDRLQKCEDLRIAAGFFDSLTRNCPWCTNLATQHEFTELVNTMAPQILVQWPRKS